MADDRPVVEQAPRLRLLSATFRSQGVCRSYDPHIRYAPAHQDLVAARRLSCSRDSAAADDQGAPSVVHRPAEPAEGEVEFQEMRESPGVGDVIDGRHLEILAVQRQPMPFMCTGAAC